MKKLSKTLILFLAIVFQFVFLDSVSAKVLTVFDSKSNCYVYYCKHVTGNVPEYRMPNFAENPNRRFVYFSKFINAEDGREQFVLSVQYVGDTHCPKIVGDSAVLEIGKQKYSLEKNYNGNYILFPSWGDLNFISAEFVFTQEVAAAIARDDSDKILFTIVADEKPCKLTFSKAFLKDMIAVYGAKIADYEKILRKMNERYPSSIKINFEKIKGNWDSYGIIF